MPQKFNASVFRQQVRTAQRKVERQLKRAIDDYNRKAEQHNRKVIADYNRKVDGQNRAADRHNQEVINDLNRRLQGMASRPAVRYTIEERQLTDRVHEAIAAQDDRGYDLFLSYARIDGLQVAEELRNNLQDLGVT